MLGGHFFIHYRFVPRRRANFVELYIRAAKHKVNTYDPITMFPFGADHEVLNVSRDWNPAIYLF